MAEQLAKTNIDIFQFRFTTLADRVVLEVAIKIGKIVHRVGKMFIINNRPDIALLCEADGVHLGENDIPVNKARKLLGKNRIIGRTIHSFAEFKQAHKESIDYISVGPIFKSKTKSGISPIAPSQLKKILSLCQKPIFGVGGITKENIKEVSKTGIPNIALCQGIVFEKYPIKVVRYLKKCLNEVS